jgi:ferritin-like metal-binding protein YciE
VNVLVLGLRGPTLLLFYLQLKLLLIIRSYNIHTMSRKSEQNVSSYNGTSPTNDVIAIAGLSLALSYENAAIDRLQKRLQESTVPEVKQKIKHHLQETREQQRRLSDRIKALGQGMEPITEKGRLPLPEPPQSLKLMIERNSSDNEKEVWESLNDLIIERAEVIMYKGGIQALELLKADKKTIQALEKNLKEEQAFGDWLEKNNPKIARKLMTKQLQHKKKRKKDEAALQKQDREVEPVAPTAT